MNFTLLLPAYNEAGRLPGTLENLAAFNWPDWVTPEILLVLDGCTDNTQEVAEAFMGRIPGLRLLPLNPNRGKGGAVREGMLQATGDWIVFTDADESYSFAHHLPLLLEKTKEDTPVVIGSRKHPGSVSDEASPPLLRQLMSAIYSRLSQALLIPGIPDAQAGLKMFRRDAAHALFQDLKLHRYEFDTELLYLARKKGFAVTTIPVSVHHVPDSRVHPIHDSLRMLTALFTIKKMHRDLP